MKNLKKIIIILLIVIILIIIIITTIILLKLKRYTIGSDYNITEFETDVSKEQIQKSVTEVTNRNEYYAIKNIIGKYAYAVADEENKSLCSMFNKNYMEENDINEENINQFVEDLKIENLTEYEMNNLKLTTVIDKMLYLQGEVNIKVFFVYGNFSNNINKQITDFKIIVEMDSRNNTFNIYPTSYMEKYYSDEEDIYKYSINIKEIEENDYNTFSFVNISDTKVINDYITKFKDSLININENAYNLLDENYKDNKFKNFEEYKEYVQKNINRLLSINIAKYKKDEIEDETVYLCIDDNENYYIIKEQPGMKFTIMLDSYTLALPEFVEKYDSVDNTRKVAMNIDKIIQALNIKDYQYIYSKLDDTFKRNYFQTLDDFQNYIDEKYSSTYYVEYSTYSEENGIYMQSIILKDKKNSEQKETSIIMKLKENYDFVMSFNVEN